jgi:hypothetical protein
VIHSVFHAIHHSIKHSHRVVNSIGGYYARNPHKIIDHGSNVIGYGGTAAKMTGKALAYGGYHAGRLTVKHGPTVVKAAGSLAAKGGVHIGKMVWTHGPTVAKHTTNFMVKSALKGFKLISS